MQQIEKRAFSIDEICERWHIGRNTAYNLIANGTLPTSKAGRRRIVTAEQEEQFRENLEAGKGAGAFRKKREGQQRDLA